MNNETWKDIPEYEGYYIINNKGVIKSVERKVNHSSGSFFLKKSKVMNTWINKVGYPCVGLSKNGKTKSVTVHSIIGKLFIPNPKNKTEINHIDGDKTNNDLRNLEWVTRSENLQHAYDNKLKCSGNEHYACKIKNEEIPVIKKMRDDGMSNIEIAKKYNCSDSLISILLSGKSRKWNPIPKKKLYGNRSLSDSQILEIVSLLNKKLKQRYIAQMYNVSENVISAIKSGRNYSEITGIKRKGLIDAGLAMSVYDLETNPYK